MIRIHLRYLWHEYLLGKNKEIRQNVQPNIAKGRRRTRSDRKRRPPMVVDRSLPLADRDSLSRPDSYTGRIRPPCEIKALPGGGYCRGERIWLVWTGGPRGRSVRPTDVLLYCRSRSFCRGRPTGRSPLYTLYNG